MGIFFGFSCRNVVAFLFIQSIAFSCPDLRYLHGTSNPYPPPQLILFPVTLASKNDLRRVKNKEIHLDIAKGICPTTLSSYITRTALVVVVNGNSKAAGHYDQK